MQFYGLLHLNAQENSAHNVRVSGFENQIDVYLGNALTLSRSLNKYGLKFTLLTNEKIILDRLINKRGEYLEVVEIPFCTNVPPGIRFYSAHFKIDALQHIANSDNEYAALCDIDVLCLNKMPKAFANIINDKIPLFYDISDQVIPAYGQKTIIDDLSALSKINAQGRWAGGEFLAGTPLFFEKVCAEIADLWPEYLRHVKNLHHTGDEAVVSAALEVMVNHGERICDAGTLGIINRFWSIPTHHRQRPLDHYKTNFLLHLPADKLFLNDMSHKKYPFSLMKDYECHLRKKRVFTFPKRIIKYVFKSYTAARIAT